MQLTYKFIFKITLAIFSCFFFSCATKAPQYGKEIKKNFVFQDIDTAKALHTFYLIGDAGNTDELKSKQILSSFKRRLDNAERESTLLFLGDNIYPIGFTAQNDSLPKVKLLNQLHLADDFKGSTIFIPGNHDWYSGLDGVERQADFVTAHLKDKKAFLPRKSCAIEVLKMDNDISLIAIDSQWYLADWDKHPEINKNCEIKTREGFFDELESLLKKNQNKTVVIALHHPLLTNGSHGGQFSIEKQFFPLEKKIPLPILGSIANLLRKTSGASPQDNQNKIYRTFSNRIQTLLSQYQNVVVVSGHDHNLQYIEKNNVKQIVSGSGSKTEAAKAVGKFDFSYGGNGYAILKIRKKGMASVQYYGIEGDIEKLLFTHNVLIPTQKYDTSHLAENFPAQVSTSIYATNTNKKSFFYNILFGKHYRDYYSMPILAKTVSLDTIYGGLIPTRAGGGHQSKSLRLQDPEGREYVMRALKKSATQFLQSVAFRDQVITQDFENTYAENFLLDFYTTSHPFAPFAVGHLADFVGISHSNPQLFYIPKQKILGDYNSEYGDELYMIEERAAGSQIELETFGDASDIISSSDVLKNLHKSQKYSVDTKSYIRSRLFDMLIGDWDRHDDQWRWGEYIQGDSTIYRAIARDRDQAFSKYDGAAIRLIMTTPELRHMQTFKSKIRNIKWFNREPYPLDIAFLTSSTAADWLAEAEYIKSNLTDKNIETAFFNLPDEVKDKTLETIKANLKIRRDHLQKYAQEYYDILQETAIVVGTNKKDKFKIERKADRIVEVGVYRIKSTGEEFLYKKDFFSKKTKHLWIYGLEDDDMFEVLGNQKSSIKIKLIGGQNHDSYLVENGRKLKIYDFKTKKNTIEADKRTVINLRDNYKDNSYSYKKPKYNFASFLPTIGYNPDDNMKLGFIVNYTVNNFKQNPYTQKHSFKGDYFFETEGVELSYKGSFPELLGKWGLEVHTLFTTPNFTMNYFGFGNNTRNQDEEKGMNFNRVRIQKIKIGTAIKKVGRSGSEVSIRPQFEQFEVEKTDDRFINILNNVNRDVFLNQYFFSTQAKYKFTNLDFESIPSLGLDFGIAATWTTNLYTIEQNFPTLETNLGIFHHLDAQKNIVLATNTKYKKIFTSNYFFYQAASIGGDSDLRGYRNERFIGDSYFVQTTDLRVSIGSIKESIAPLSYGLFAGFDYGRVWIEAPEAEVWRYDYGGGIWINTVKKFTARISMFKAPDEEARISFGLNFNF